MKGRLQKRGQTWSYIVDLPPYPDGRRRQKWKGGFRTKRDAEAALAQILVDVAHGLPGSTSKAKVGDFLTDWLASVAPSLDPATVALNECAIRRWIAPNIGGMKVANLLPAHLQGLYNKLHDDGLSERSVRLAHTVLSQALGQALDWGVIGRNPAKAKLKIPKSATREKIVYTGDQARRFLEVTTGDRLAPLWALFLSTGLRRGEALGLRWENVDFPGRALHVKEAYVAGKTAGGPSGSMKAPKTKGSRRVVPLVDGAIAALTARAEQQVRDAEEAGAAWQGSGFVFTDQLGRPLRPDSIGKRLKAAQRKAGVPETRCHDLRHSFASIALEEDVHPKLVQMAMGHSQITTTMDLYTRSNPDLQRAALESIGNAVFSRPVDLPLHVSQKELGA